MGTDAGTNGVFGLLLSEHYPEHVAALNSIRCEDDTLDNGVPDETLKKIVDKFKEDGIILPEGVELVYTGSDEERPGRCETPENDWVIGLGIFIRPDQYPKMHESFLGAARFWTWVTCG
jgi:hypothetical protein